MMMKLWNCIKNLVAMVCDTTASNTGKDHCLSDVVVVEVEEEEEDKGKRQKAKKNNKP